jgi:putative ABC transport system permease protein
MENLIQDCRYGIRMLLKNPGFTAIAVLTLTLGIGANSAIFSVVNAVLLQPLPYDHPDRLVILNETSQQMDSMSISYPNFVDWRDRNRVFEQLAVYRRQSFNLTGGAKPEQIVGGEVSASLFPALRTQPVLGRSFTENEDKPGGAQVVVLSYGLWQSRFSGSKDVAGQSVNLDDKQYTVIGVMPAGFEFPTRARLWVPVGQRSSEPAWVERGNHPGLYGVARISDGATIEAAHGDMDRVAQELQRQYPGSNTGDGVRIRPMKEVYVADIRPALLVLFAAVGFVLLIACVNVANLLLARGASREKEFAVRSALGAGRFRLVRQLLTESVLLSIIGGALGLAVAKWGVKLIIAIDPNDIPRSKNIGLDWKLVGFTLAVSLFTGIVFGLVPALNAAKVDLNESLKDMGRGSTASRRRKRFRQVLIISEVSLALVLLIGAGLVIRSFYKLVQVDPGFKTENVLSFSVTLPPAKYKEDRQLINFYNQTLDRLSVLPGVLSAAESSGLPLGNNGNQTSFRVVGQPDPLPGQAPLVEIVSSSPAYFDTMKIPLLKGRLFTDQDGKDAPRVIVVDSLFATRHWPGEDAVGKQLKFGDPKAPPITVIGVVGRVRMEGLDTDSDRVQAYTPYPQDSDSSMNFIIRTARDPQTITRSAEEQVQAVDADEPIYNIQTLSDLWQQSIAPQRMNLVLLGVFAGLALLLSMVGIYGVTAYSVSQRTHELGVRMALGARPSNILGMVMGNGMATVILGLVIGLVAAYGLTRLMASLLFTVSPHDPVTFVAIPVILAFVAIVAHYIPAIRATKVDPISALRYE